ncbi:hypothetical protein RMCBS344292_10641 [Rhizopus microsporus]|nr:hypothetical protein RMCBS344292_10641 [Rhizopus microsporus]
MESFKEWANDNGIKTNGVTIETTQYSGNGLFASSHIKENTCVVEIPESLILTAPKVLRTGEQPFLSPVYKYFMTHYELHSEEEVNSIAMEQERFLLCLFLIYYRFFATSSSWTPYMRILPSTDYFKDNHLFFNDFIVKGTCLEASVRTKLSVLRHELDEIKSQGSGWLSDIEWDMYVWADCAFWSRAVGIGESEVAVEANLALVPFFDLANHSLHNSNIRWILTESNNLQLVSTQDIEVDQECCLSYGSKPNQELLFIHGFSIPGNPELSRVTIPIARIVDPSYPFDMIKIEWLKAIGAKSFLSLMPQKVSDCDDCFIAEGWLPDSVATVYLIALSEDDDVLLSSQGKDGQPILMLNDSHGEVRDLDDLLDRVKRLDLFPVIQTRAAVLLWEAVEQCYSLNVDNDPAKLGYAEHDSAKAFLLEQAHIYRLEEQDILNKARSWLLKTQDEFSQNEVVQAYLKTVANQ